MECREPAFPRHLVPATPGVACHSDAERIRRIGITGPSFMIGSAAYTLQSGRKTMTTLFFLLASIAAPVNSLPCPPPLAKAHARCESVTVAEDPAKPEGRKIDRKSTRLNS